MPQMIVIHRVNNQEKTGREFRIAFPARPDAALPRNPPILACLGAQLAERGIAMRRADGGRRTQAGGGSSRAGATGGGQGLRIWCFSHLE